MKSLSANSLQKRRRASAARAFTLPEVLLSLTIFLMAIAAVVTLQILGLKMNMLTATKLKSTVSGLKVLNHLHDRVLESNSAMVGNGDDSSFVATGTIGNALQVYPGTNTGTYIRFFLSTNDATLYEWNSTNNALSAIASSITNELAFQTVDFQGNISSSSQEHYAIQMTLHFNRLSFTVPHKTYEHYTLQTEMTPRGQ